MLMRGSHKAPKETRHPTSDHANALDAPFSTPSGAERETLAPSSLALRDFNKHEKLVLAGRSRTHSMSPPILRPDRSCALLTPASSDPKSRSSTLLGTSRPSVIVYKVATGPNFPVSRDVIRVSYGEGHRKRTPLTNSSNRNKEHTLGRQGYSTKGYGIIKRRDTTEHLNRKSTRSKLCPSRRYHDDKLSPSDLRRADKKMSGVLPPAGRVEGDMAWDFGAGPGRGVRPVDADRSRVRVGGLTSVRMIPRTAANCGIGSEAISMTS